MAILLTGLRIQRCALVTAPSVITIGAVHCPTPLRTIIIQSRHIESPCTSQLRGSQDEWPGHIDNCGRQSELPRKCIAASRVIVAASLDSKSFQAFDTSTSRCMQRSASFRRGWAESRSTTTRANGKRGWLVGGVAMHVVRPQLRPKRSNIRWIPVSCRCWKSRDLGGGGCLIAPPEADWMLPGGEETIASARSSPVEKDRRRKRVCCGLTSLDKETTVSRRQSSWMRGWERRNQGPWEDRWYEHRTGWFAGDPCAHCVDSPVIPSTAPPRRSAGLFRASGYGAPGWTQMGLSMWKSSYTYLWPGTLLTRYWMLINKSAWGFRRSNDAHRSKRSRSSPFEM